MLDVLKGTKVPLKDGGAKSQGGERVETSSPLTSLRVA